VQGSRRFVEGSVATVTEFLTPKEAAKMLRVSPGYLRNSDCPKVLLPTQGKRAIVRYDRIDLETWASKWKATPLKRSA
jgi:hypothetical protein